MSEAKGPPIIAPRNSWCPRHWAEIRSDPSINSVFASIRVVTRILELDRFYERAYGPTPWPGAADIDRINVALLAITPLCCYLGDEEMVLLRGEARSIGRPRS
jgi:hypothetical protein